MPDPFAEHRRLLFSVAYNLLGSVADAEDVVQETWLRWAAHDRADVLHPRAYLTRIVTTQALNRLRANRSRRETYIGPWLPEPLLTPDPARGPLQTLEQQESLSLAFLVLMECLTPQERAVFLLREVFEHSYEEIASILGSSAASCRQMFHRAQKRLAERRPRFKPEPAQQQRLFASFVAACQRGDLAALIQALAQDVTIWSDGGGKASAARRPIVGRDAVARFLLGLVRIAPENLRIQLVEVNTSPALLLWEGDSLISVMVFDFEGEHLQAVHAARNPDKLAFIESQARGRGE